MIEIIHTIGGYGYSRDMFFNKLEENGVDVLVDIRQRRGMRGRIYSFLNSNALQDELRRIGVAYVYIKELAPTSEIRNAQKQEDERLLESKRDRSRLSDAFREGYCETILSTLDVDDILEKIQSYRRPCFFCVEGIAEACHRSLVADWLSKCRNFPVNNISVAS